MIARVNFKLGDTTYQFEADEKDEMDSLHKAIILGNPPKKCDECSNDSDFSMDSNKDKEANTYVNVVCNACGAKAKLGLYKAGGFFWHKFKKWVGKETEEKIKGKKDDEAIDPNEIPF